MPVSTNYTACSVNNLDKMGRPWRRFHCRVKLLTAGHTACSVKGALDNNWIKKDLKCKIEFLVLPPGDEVFGCVCLSEFAITPESSEQVFLILCMWIRRDQRKTFGMFQIIFQIQKLMIF